METVRGGSKRFGQKATPQRGAICSSLVVTLALALTVLLAPSAARAEIGFRVPSYVVLNARTGQVIAADNPDAKRYPASLTKLMTLYLAFGALRDRRITLSTRMPVSVHAADVEPVKLGLLPGSTISVRSAILSMVTLSANDAATVLGEYLGGGSEARFAEMMTLRAHAMGMTHTVFRTASGLPAPGQHTTAHDIAILARRLILDFPNEYHWFSTRRFLFRGRWIVSDDNLLRSYPGADGMKTGYTDRAGHNLVSSAVHGDVRLIAVVLGAQTIPQIDGEMVALLNRGFADVGAPAEGTTEVASGTLRAPLPTPRTVLRAPAPLPRPTLRPPHTRFDAPATWGVQVAAYQNRHMANYVSGLAAHFVAGRPIIQVTNVRGRTLWEVRFVGMSGEAAKTACHDLNRRKLPCWLLPPQQYGEVASR